MCKLFWIEYWVCGIFPKDMLWLWSIIWAPPLFGDMGEIAKKAKRQVWVGLGTQIVPVYSGTIQKHHRTNTTSAAFRWTIDEWSSLLLLLDFVGLWSLSFYAHHGFTPSLLILFNLNCILQVSGEKFCKASITRCKGINCFLNLCREFCVFFRESWSCFFLTYLWVLGDFVWLLFIDKDGSMSNPLSFLSIDGFL